MIEFKGVSKSFGNIKAVSDITFKIGKGDFVFITGPSGAGKTTLLKLILREIVPDSGHIIFDGVNIVGLTDKDIPHLRQKMGVVFQDFKVLPERTLRENVEVPLAVVGIEPSQWKARVDQVLKLVGLSERSELFPSQLSGGELQRVSLARALVVNPKLILADEPTGNLDWDTADSIMELFEKINQEGKTVIMATHNKMVLEKYKKRIIELKDGRLVGEKGVKSEKEEEKAETEEEEEMKEEKETEEVKEIHEGQEKQQRPKLKVKVEEI